MMHYTHPLGRGARRGHMLYAATIMQHRTRGDRMGPIHKSFGYPSCTTLRGCMYLAAEA